VDQHYRGRDHVLDRLFLGVGRFIVTQAELDLLMVVALLVRDAAPPSGRDVINKRIRMMMVEKRDVGDEHIHYTKGYNEGVAKMKEIALAIVDDARDHEADGTNAAQVIASVYLAIKGFNQTS
jgi:hypothetical protein